MSWLALVLSIAPVVVIAWWMAQVRFRVTALSGRQRAGILLLLSLTLSGVAWLVTSAAIQSGLRMVAGALLVLWVVQWTRQPRALPAE
jgi:hypothetical protein